MSFKRSPPRHPDGSPGPPATSRAARDALRRPKLARRVSLGRRVAELEAELASCRVTIAAMESEHGGVAPTSAQRSADLEAANAELRALTANLDKIVRQRTRALAESEAQLRRKNEELKRLNIMKAEFISIAAHELRTPMTSIVGYLDLLLEGKFDPLPAPLQKPIASLARNAHRLKRLVDEMLDISRIEAGRMTLMRRPHDLGEIVTDVVQELAPLAAAKRQTVEAEIQEVPQIPCDADKIHQVVANLMANAIRYTPEEGIVQLIVDRAPPRQYPGHWVRLRVRDNGVGIPVAERARIFEPFSDVHPARHHTSSGPDSAGLGLYIARGLVDLHGGLITVESEEGEYTEFTVLLPLID